MAGIAAHLIVAREILKLLPDGIIQDKGLFYAGSIAPDAVHARENYVRADKKHSHLRDDILDKDFIKKESLDLFHQRITDFILKNRDRKDGLLDYYRGYVAHLLTDELYILSVRQEFVDQMMKLGIEQTNQRFFELVVADMTRCDDLLVKYDMDLDEIKQLLEKVKPYPIEGMVNETELRDSLNWVIRWYFTEKRDFLDPVYITYERTLEFIGAAADDIVKRLTYGLGLPKML